MLSLWFLVNLVQATFTELFHDEAYYWVFARFPDWGYKDHPPVTALLVRAGDLLAGGELGVRLFMVVLSTLALWLAWRIVRPENSRLFWTLAMAMPILHAFGFLAVPDVPLLCFGVLFLAVWKRWLVSDTWATAFALAACLILLAYTKYHGALLFAFAVLPNLTVLRRARFWVVVILVLLGMAPHLWWQYAHDWLSFRYHLRDRAGDVWKFRFVPEYLAGQLAIWGPFTGILLWLGAIRWTARDAFERSLKWIALGFVLFFFLQSWKQPTEANWTGPVFLPLLYLGYQDLNRRPKTAAWAIRLGLVTLALLLVARVYLLWDFIGQKKAPEFHHWDEWAEVVSRTAGEVPVVFTNRYQRPSKYLFYSRKPGYCESTEVDTGTQFDLLYGMEESVQGKRVCIVTEHPRPESLQDTILEDTPSGRPLGFRWVDDFRSYNRIWCRMDTPKRQFPPDTDLEIPVTITNPTDYTVSWDTAGPRQVTFEYLFILRDIVRQDGLALTTWPVTRLEPGQTVSTTIRVHTPVEPATYRFRMAWRVEGLLRGKNSGFYELEIVDPPGSP